MKNLKNFAATVAMLLCCITASAYDFEVEGLGYTITSADELTVSVAQGATAPIGDLVIPSTVTNEEVTYSVTAIAASAFSGCSELTSMTIPASVTTIGENAFKDCTTIKELTFKDATETLSIKGTSYSILKDCSLEKLYLGRDLAYFIGFDYAPFARQTALTSVIISDKVTTIGAYMFNGCSGLTSITIPTSVTTIGNAAFYGCSSLTSLTIPASVTTIDDRAFLYCSAIKELTIEDGTEILTLKASSMFSSCPLEKVYWGRDLDYTTAYNKAPFNNQTALTSVTIGDMVTTIGSSAFYGCTALTSLTIPASVTTIGSSAFYNCSNLSSLVIGNSVTTIGSQAFYNCVGLASISIPASVVSIGEKAFDGCSGITELILEDGLDVLNFTNDDRFASCPLEKLYLGRDLSYSATSTSSSPFANQTALSTVVIGNSVTKLSSNLFKGCSSLSSITIPASVTSIGSDVFSGCTAIKELTLEDGVESLRIGSSFSSCPLEKAYLGRDLTNYSPFSNQTALTSVTIGEKVTVIYSNAFSGCSGLTSLTIPASVTTIGSYAFSGCSGLTSMTIPASVTTIGSNAFYNCTAMKEVTFEDGSEVLVLQEDIDNNSKKSLFVSCPLEKVYLGRDLAYTGFSNAAPFYHQTALTSLTIGEKVTVIGSSAFSGCSGLTSLTIPASVTTIGSSAFYHCDGLTSLTLGDAVTTIGGAAFSGCSGLTSLTIPASVTTIDGNAFYNCDGLTSLVLGDAVTTIGPSAFSGCSGLTSLTIPASVTTIGSSAFYCCDGLTSLTLGDAVNFIGSKAFLGCISLVEINAKSLESWLRIEFETKESNPTYINESLLYIDGELVTDIEIPSTITEVKDFAFYDYDKLLSVNLGDAVVSIGAEAFCSCNGLTSLFVGDAVKSIDSGAFKYCSLKDLHIGNIDAWAAIECGDQYSHPNYYATNIYHNDKLVTEVEIPTTITTIPDYTFYNFGDVVKVKLHEGVESIGQSAFLSVPAVFEVAATAVPTLGTSAISAPSVVVVPQEAGTAYSEADGWANLIITTNDVYEQTLTLEAAEDASSLHKTLGDAKLDSVVNLTISGTINSYDFMVMRTKMTKLRNLDLTNATVKYNAYQHYTGYHTADSVIPGYAFYNCNLFDVKFPSNTKSVEYKAVSKNNYLRGVELPKGMTTIGDYTFAEDSRLREVTIPEGVKTVGYCAFASCSKLDNMVFPTTLEDLRGRAFASTSLSKVDFSKTNLTDIGEYAFSECRKLEEVKLPSKTLQAIYVYAFQNCTSLKEFRIPSSVRSISNNAFTGCTNLEKVYVYTVEPISIGQNTFALTGNNFVGALYAPRVSYYTYWYDTQWGQFQSVNEFDEPYEYAYFEGDTTLDPSTGTVDGDGETLPDADMGSQSGNTVNGAEATEEEEEEGGETPAAANGMRRTQAATATTLTQEWGTLNVAHNGTDGASIIAKNGGAVTAETANFRINVTGGKWYFLSFPFDIKKENIKCEGGANYVFRYYDGAVRAAKGSGGWTNVAVADDGTYLKAGKGYIFQASKSDVLVLTVEDMSIVSEDKNTTVEAYAADNTANASWNFVGNPYLSYYNVTAADYSAPITVWNGSSYQAVRPGDDEYQLAPFEAFFVQKPEGVNGITYATTSQTTYQKIQAAAAAAPGRRTAEINPDRLLVNIALTDGTTADQTRVVFNNAVSMDYEMECDAAKFSTAGVPQLYTIDSRAVKYAINERPVAEGIVTMGFTAPAQGVYTLSAPRMDTPMLLRDNATGTIHDFAEGSYEFASEAGTFDDRFTLMMKAGETTSIDNSQWTIDSEAPVYNTKGQRVNEATEQGVYIKGNRKVVTL